MNKKQIIVLWIGVIVFCAIAILPWEKTKSFGGIGIPTRVFYRRIQPPKLYVYWIITTVVTGALIISLKESK